MLEEGFLQLSVALTGFDAAELIETGMAGGYYGAVCGQIGAGPLDELAGALSETGGDPNAVTDPELREVARAVCWLWYLGVWPGVPEQAADRFGLTGRQSNFRPQAEAYAQGLLWRALGSPAPGTGSPGFGSWAQAPPGADPVEAGLASARTPGGSQ